MELLTPGIGLIFWQAVVFLLLFLVLLKFAWKPIIKGLQAREGFIADSLEKAEAAQEQAQATQQKNEALIEEAHRSRDQLLKQAQDTAARIEAAAKEAAQKEAQRMLSEAKKSIHAEEKAALERLQHMVAELAVEISEKVLRQSLTKEAAARSLIEKYVKELPSPN